jgi:DNA-directed RNA polymerase specialized sigma24 family protein
MKRLEAQALPPVRTGVEGYADAMGIFPRLKEWENQIALQALREGKSVHDLRGITPFRQYLGVDKRALLAGETSPFSSFSTLFTESPSIDMLVSLGNFHLITSRTRKLARQYQYLHLPLDQFYQDALYNIIPYQARAYNATIGNPFQNFAGAMLKKRFLSFVSSYKREMSTPVGYEEKEKTKKGRAVQRRGRVNIVSLDMQMPRSIIPQTFFEYLEYTNHATLDTTTLDDQEAKEKIHLLSSLAGLNHKQEETLIALYIYGGDTTLIAKSRRTTTRSVRGQRQTALESIQQLGYETVNGILTDPRR